MVLKNFRFVDEKMDALGTVTIHDGIITGFAGGGPFEENETGNGMVIDGSKLSPSCALPVIMPAFVDLHAHFRDPGPSESKTLPSELALPSEVIESASMAAAAGGFGTVICMANTRPPIDTIQMAAALKTRSDALGLIDLYPAMSLTKGMLGKGLSEITSLMGKDKLPPQPAPLMLSEDGKDLADGTLFLAAMEEAKRIGIPISCHCDFGGDENNAVRRVIELGKKAGCHIHIAHVSSSEAIETIRRTKAEISSNAKLDSDDKTCFTLTCEATPHHLCLTEEDSRRLGEKTWGAVNPPLRPEGDRKALIQALFDGTVDVIATDHAPHSRTDKEAGSPGFSGFETAFAAVYTVPGGAGLAGQTKDTIGLKHLSSLMSAAPARLLGLGASQKRGLRRGRILPGYKADLVVIDTDASWIVESASFKSRGKNSPFVGRRLYGKILMTLHSGRVVFQR